MLLSRSEVSPVRTAVLMGGQREPLGGGQVADPLEGVLQVQSDVVAQGPERGDVEHGHLVPEGGPHGVVNQGC